MSHKDDGKAPMYFMTGIHYLAIEARTFFTTTRSHSKLYYRVLLQLLLIALHGGLETAAKS